MFDQIGENPVIAIQRDSQRIKLVFAFEAFLNLPKAEPNFRTRLTPAPLRPPGCGG